MTSAPSVVRQEKVAQKMDGDTTASGAPRPSTAAQRDGTRVIYFDVIRACAMVCVILIHVSVGELYSGRIGSFSWWAADFFDSFARPCVPLFLMTSGALLLEERHKESVHTFFKKRAMRVILPFAFWAAVYMMWRIGFHHEHMTLRSLLVNLWTGNVYLHLWFIYTIIGLYLVTPILRVFVRHTAPDVWKLFFTLWFIFGSVFLFVQKATGLGFNIDPPLVTGYAGYFLLGWYLHHHYQQKTNAALLWKIIALTIFTAVATHFISVKKGSAAEAFFVFLNPNIVIASFYAFLFFRDYDWKKLFQRAPLLNRLVMLLSSASLGIYFVHVLVLELISGQYLPFAMIGSKLPAIISIPWMTLMTTFLSLMIVLAMKKLPLLKLFVA